MLFSVRDDLNGYDTEYTVIYKFLNLNRMLTNQLLKMLESFGGII